ncbi:hypothetical protein N2152v2_002941 [Parachlorella kessleri]
MRQRLTGREHQRAASNTGRVLQDGQQQAGDVGGSDAGRVLQDREQQRAASDTGGVLQGREQQPRGNDAGRAAQDREQQPSASNISGVLQGREQQPAAGTSGTNKRALEAASGSKRQRAAASGRLDEQEAVGAAPQGAVVQLVPAPPGEQPRSLAMPQPSKDNGTLYTSLLGEMNELLEEAEEQNDLPRATSTAYTLKFSQGDVSSLQRDFKLLARWRDAGQWDAVVRFVVAATG